MAREQLDAIAKSHQFLPQYIDALITAAREALELREALEFVATDTLSLYESGDGYCCVLFEGGADVEKCIYGATPLEAIKRAREACDGAGKNQG